MAQKGETIQMALIDGDINKSVQVKMALETAGEDTVSDDLYAKLHAWLSETIQQERNHWKKKMDAMLQEIEQQRKTTLSIQGSLQQLLERATVTGGNVEPPLAITNYYRELTSGSNFNEYYNSYEEKENTSTKKVIENLGTVIENLKFEIDTLQGRLRESESVKMEGSNSRHDAPVKSVMEPPTNLTETVNEDDPGKLRSENHNGWMQPAKSTNTTLQKQAKQSSSKSIVNPEKSTVNLEKSTVIPEKSTVNPEKQPVVDMDNGNNTENGVEKSEPIRIGQGSAESYRGNAKKISNSSDQTSKPIEPTKIVNNDPKNKSPCSDHGRTSVPITTCQVWSTTDGARSRGRRLNKDSGEPPQKAIVRPFLKKGVRGAGDSTEKFSVKKLTSLAHEEKHQYERKIQGKNKEIKLLQSELENARSKVQKLQRVIERLYFLQQTLKNSVNVSPGPDDIAINEQGSKIDRSHVRSKVLLESVPSLSQLPMFQPMAGDEIALWKLRIKRQSPKVTKLDKGHVTQCLRCQRLFRPKDNTPVACRFHSKGQESVEKYDNHGRLVKVVYKWGCCNKMPDAPGCTHGQHM